MPVTIETTVFEFDELNDAAKDVARDWFRGASVHDDWYDSVYEDAKTCAALIGINIDKIYFSGFSSQGDGACFEGHYAYVKGAANAIKSYAVDPVLASIADDLQALQSKNFYRLTATVKHSGHYYHEYCTDIEVLKDGYYLDSFFNKEDTIKELTEILRRFMRWTYSQLEKEYDYITSNECVDDNIRCNEYTFTFEGKRFG